MPLTSTRLPKVRRSAAEVLTTPPGPIGAAVIKAARRRVRLSQRGLAQRLAVPRSTVDCWEAGTTPLYCTDYGRLRQLAAALSPDTGGAQQVLHTLLLASQCDLLFTAMLHGFEDYAEVPPIDEDTADGETTRTLLRWALTGTVSPPYKEHSAAGRLLAQPDVTRIRELSLLLQAGAQGPDLHAFGATLAMLTAPGDWEAETHGKPPTPVSPG
jgi:DNA-binding XRE family transcriptional regulator